MWTIFLEAQKKALSHAAKVDVRLFTREEHASAYCQVGNLPLSLDVMTDWLKRR